MKTILLLISLLGATLVSAQDYVPVVIWDRSGETDSSAYGYKILPLGDQNDDGFADWAVLARGNVATYHGTRGTYLEFFYGSANPSTEPAFVLTQDPSEYYQTWFATEAGDLNGDGYVDWYVSYAPWNAPGSRTYGFFWGGSEPSQTPDFLWPSATGWYRMQDFNGDGYDDLYSTDAAEVGRMYFGGNQMDTIPDWILSQPPEGLIQSIPYAVGDFNGDGASDFMIYQSGGNLAIFLGGADPDTVVDYFWTDMTSPKTGLDSLNGDFADEFVRGGRHIHLGRPELSPNPDATLNSIAGLYAADGGDYNNDGYHDLILYSRDCFPNPFGCLSLHLGHPWINPDPVFVIEGDTPPYFLRGIYTAIGLGDIDGDTLGDIAVGVWHETFGPWRGKCVILGGDTLPVSANPARPELPHDITIEAYPNPFNAATTIKLTLPWSERLNEMTIYNTLGQTVRQEVLPPFVSQVTYGFDARDLPSGFYLLEVRSGTLSRTQKLILLR